MDEDETFTYFNYYKLIYSICLYRSLSYYIEKCRTFEILYIDVNPKWLLFAFSQDSHTPSFMLGNEKYAITIYFLNEYSMHSLNCLFQFGIDVFVEGIMDIRIKHLSILFILEKRGKYFKILYMFTIWLYWQVWAPDPEFLNYTILVKCLMNIFTMYLIFPTYVRDEKNIFQMLPLLAYLAPWLAWS